MKKGALQKAPAGKKTMEPAEIKKLFTKYSKGKQFMTDEDLFQFMGDAGMEADDPFFGYLATLVMGIKKIERTEYENFEALIKYAKVESLQDLKDKIKHKELHGEISSDNTYKAMYKKVFDLYTGKYDTLEFEVAVALWSTFLKSKLTTYPQFMSYLEKLPEHNRVYRDLWNMVIEFAYQVKNVKNDYKEDDGWPIFIDKYVEHLNGGEK